MNTYDKLSIDDKQKMKDLFYNKPKRHKTIGELWYDYHDYWEMKLRQRSKRKEGYLEKLIRDINE